MPHFSYGKSISATTEVNENVSVWNNYMSNKELQNFFKEYDLKPKNVESAYQIQDNDQTHYIVNVQLNENGDFINIYFANEELFSYSIQKYDDKTQNSATFELYDAVDDTLIMSESISKDKEITTNYLISENEVSTYALTDKQVFALKWACIFSSYMGCIGASLAAGAAGTLISGPVGTVTGALGGWACRYLFQTAVEQFGGKQAACKFFS